MTTSVLPDRPGLLDRALRLVTDVRTGEGTTALLLALNIFLVLSAYYLIKPVREALILGGGGAEVKSYASAGQALLLLLLVPLYGQLADRLPRRKLINAVTAFFVVCLVTFYVLAQAGAAVGVPFFLWAGIFNLMMVAQAWSFANDIYSREQGERLFPVVAFGASMGAVVGSAVAGRLIPILGVPQLLLLAGVLLLAAAAVTNVVDARERNRAEAGIPARFTTAEMPAATGEYQVEKIGDVTKVTLSIAPGAGPQRSGFSLVFGDRYLLSIAFLILILNWVNSTGEYILGNTVARSAAALVETGQAGGLSVKEYIGKFYSDFFFAVNLLGVVLQLFIVSRILKYLGVRAAVLMLPLLAVTGYAVLAFFPVLAVVRWVKTAENATDYSLQNTVRNVLFLPTSREQKYKAKQAIDGFFVRSGDVLSALLVYVGSTILGFAVTDFARVNLVLALGWVALAAGVGRLYLRKTTGRTA
jgi:AAA family ATP:ADP antiporter